MLLPPMSNKPLLKLTAAVFVTAPVPVPEVPTFTMFPPKVVVPPKC